MKNARFFHHKKSLGQNFLSDLNILRAIVRKASPHPEDSILEIGAGQGVLTRELLASPCSFLFSVEIDRGLAPFLANLPLLHSKRFALIWGDALQMDFTSLTPSPSKVVANIPYNITTPLLWHLLETLQETKYFLLMVQKEAADRIVALPRTKARYPLGITLEVMGKASSVLKVPPQAFRPVPKVESRLLEISLSGEHATLPCDPLWRDMLRRGFSQRRKKLSKNLRAFRPEIPWEELFSQVGIEENARAEELSGSQWLTLLEFLRER